jgi:cell division topological specificity factor
MTPPAQDKPRSASLARERLRVLIQQDQTERNAPDYLPALRLGLREVVHKHIDISPEDVQIRIGYLDGRETLALFVPLVHNTAMAELPPSAAGGPGGPPRARQP